MQPASCSPSISLGCGTEVVAAPTLDPEACLVTAHARQRYLDRRDTHPEAVEAGIMRLLRQAARKATPPARFGMGGNEPHRTLVVGGYVLVFNQDMNTLITLWPAKADRRRPGRQRT